MRGISNASLNRLLKPLFRVQLSRAIKVIMEDNVSDLKAGFWRVVFPAGVLSMLLWAPPAHAYLDPGTGSVILQGLLAGVAGLAVVLKLYWSRIKARFHRARGKSVETKQN